MNRNLSRPRLLLAAGLCSLALSLPLHAAPRPVEVDRIVAVVNNEVVTALQLRARVDQAVRQLQRQGGQLPPADVLERQLLERLIVERAQLQLARETSLRVDDATLERAIDRIAANNRLSVEQLREALAKDGVTWSRFRDEIRTEILLTRLREREVDSKVVVTDAEIDNFLASNPDAFSGQEFEVAHVLLRAPEQASPQQIEALRTRAEGVMARLRSGEDFARVAAEVSDAPDGLSGGSLGWRPLDRLPALFAEAVRNMRPGETSQVLRSASGLHIVRLVDRRGGGDAAVAKLEQTRARHILIKTSEVLSDTDAEARLLGIRERVVNGADFGELAKASSADLSAAKGGDLGWLNPGDTVPEFERAMNALQPGEVSAPVKSPFGWHLIQVVERRVQDVTDERKRNAARAALRDRKAEEAYEDWLRQLRDSTYVDLRLERE
ncbi:peptidylprolyl isomerase [Thauera humireducens]|uniref:Chaperone SurA n=1 Tax=Thauera humireducens TaxID=1134435 RepID=A0A127K5Q9_9RHOO|nr:peptidylprolyl isomerase [Thauera humireducens]AMO37285.1 molecular chaperone SurA [Thauera humireducens]